MFYKHTHLLFSSFIFQFPNSQVQQTNTKSTTMSSTTSPPILPISNTTTTTTNHHPSATHGPSSLTSMPSAACGPSLSTQAARLGSHGPGGGQSVFFHFWVSDSINFYFGFYSWVFWDFGSLRKESGRRIGSGSLDT